MSLHSLVCPHCRFGVKYEMEYDIAHRRYIYKAFCHCSYANLNIDERQANDKLFDESYAYELAWQRWKEEVNKKSMTKVSGPANEENPDSEETGAIDSDAIWNVVIEAMASSYQEGIKDAFSDTSITKDELEEILRDRLNDLPGNGHPPDR